MNTRAALAVAAALTSAACADEVLVTPEPCDGPSWQAQLDLTDQVWTDLGGVVARHGDKVLVVWQQRDRGGLGNGIDTNGESGPDVVMRALFDGETGAVLAAPKLLSEPNGVSGLNVVGVDGGFLVFVYDTGADTRVLLVDDDGDRVSGTLVTGEAAVFDPPVLVDDDGVTLLLGASVARLDHEGSVRSTTTVRADTACSGATLTSPGRLLAWCDDVDDGHVFLLDMAVDGADVHEVDVDVPDHVAGRVVVADDVVFAAFEDDGDVFAAAFGFDGSVVVDPVVVGAALKGHALLGDDVCTGTCTGLSLAALDDGRAVVGYENLSDVPFKDKLSFVPVGLDDGDLVEGNTRLALGHAHAAVTAGDGRFVTFVDESAFTPIPWNWPAQKLTVQRTCGGR